MTNQLLKAAVSFCINSVGVIARPYETYRTIVEMAKAWELLCVAGLIAGYFALASLVKVAAFRPFLLTREFMVLMGAAVISYAFIVALLWIIGRLVGGKGTLAGLACGWGYTLLPTVIWFFTTSALFLILPPPRTTSVAGVVFSGLFLVFSVMLLFWKLMLGYLTLRFGLKLDLVRIFIVAGIIVPILGVYSVGMYRMGIFRVPFL